MTDDPDLRKIVADVAAAYLGNNHVTPTEIPTVISQIVAGLSGVGAPAAEAAPAEAEKPKLTAPQIRKSVTREALISFEDGKPYKTLRRHLTARGMTPEEYREKWGLPKDYPMAAPAYSEARSQMAKTIGLGSRVVAKPAAPPEAAAAASEPAAVKAKPKARRAAAAGAGRKRVSRKAPAAT